MNRSKQQNFDRYTDVIYELLQDQLHGLNNFTARNVLINRPIFIRMFSSLLFDAPTIHTGMVSIRMVELQLSGGLAKPCNEHHNGRQNGGQALVLLLERAHYMKREITRTEVELIVRMFCEVHYTTPAENKVLRKHQRQCSSVAAYNRADITLIEAPDLFTRRGRGRPAWLTSMREKYQPIVDSYNNPAYTKPDDLLNLPPVIY